MVSDAELGQGKTCFVVGPIGSKLAPRGTDDRIRYEEALQMWEDVLEPACADFGLTPIRADRISDPGEIPEQIFLHLRDSELVIADVTDGNPNVMYELGLRHTRDLPTIQIGQYQRLPFDINTIRTIQFSRTERGLIEARDALVDAIRSALSGSGGPVTATRVWTQLAAADPALVTAAVERSLADMDEPEVADEPGFIDLLADGERALGEVAEIMERATAAMAETGALSKEAGEKIERSDAEGRGFAGRLRIARELARNLESPTQELDTAAVDFLDRIAQMDAMVRYMLGRWQEDPEEIADSREFAEMIIGLANSAEESEVGVTSMINGARVMRGIARDLAPVGRSIEVSLNKILKGTGTITGWREPIKAIFGEPEPEAGVATA